MNRESLDVCLISPLFLFPAGAGMNREIEKSDMPGMTESLFPAGAGMNRPTVLEPTRFTLSTVPRRRGDEPYALWVYTCSSPVLFPAGAGMNRPIVLPFAVCNTYLFPAGAGMNRLGLPRGDPNRIWSVPRRRGDEPDDQPIDPG